MVVPRDTAGDDVHREECVEGWECSKSGEDSLCIVWTRASHLVPSTSIMNHIMFQFKIWATPKTKAEPKQISYSPFCHLLCVNVCVLRDPFVLSHKSITEISCRISSFFYSSPLSCITWSHAVMLYIDFYCMHHWSSITKEWYVCLYHESQGGNTWGRRIKSSWYLLQIKWRYVAARTRGENNQLSCGDSFLPSSFN